jgi:hypothetical protein
MDVATPTPARPETLAHFALGVAERGDLVKAAGFLLEDGRRPGGEQSVARGPGSKEAS